ncbi:MAG: sugar transferase [Anaerolineae bacterium]|nr:sugar transferase [Anaerolineae bacterium]
MRLSDRRLLLMGGDVVAVLAAVLIALRIWSVVGSRAFNVTFLVEQSIWFFVFVGIWLLLASANDFYDLRIVARRDASIQRLLIITLQMLVLYLIIFFLAPRYALPRLFSLYYGFASFALIGAWRLIYPAVTGWASEPRRVFIVGTDWAAETIIGAIGRYAYDEYEIKGIIGEKDEVGFEVCGVPVIGDGSALKQLIDQEYVSELIVTSTRELDGKTFQGVMDAYVTGLSIVPMPLLYERITGRVPVEHVNKNWAVVLPLDNNSVFNIYPLLKRGLDIVLALIGMIVFVMTLPVLALIIKLDSPGTIFYSQQRVGLNGRVFSIYKFRTMVSDAELRSGAVFSRKGDPRITRSGRFMRKTRLDELPQLLNILRGDMSLIGPRPERPEHVERLITKIPFYRTRLVIRPGLTGWAQVRYGYGADDDDALIKLQYDLFYIRHASLLLDMNIIIRTAGKVIRMSGV